WRRSVTGSSRSSRPSGRTRCADRACRRRTSTSSGPGSSRTRCGVGDSRVTRSGRPRYGGTKRRKLSPASARRSRPRSVSADRTAALRNLPSVDQLLRRLADQDEVRGITRARLTALVREVLGQERARVLEERTAPSEIETLSARVVERARRVGTFSLRPVINAQGVVLHTNLGRALMSPLALERLAAVATAYSNLELDLARKERGSRYSHVEALLQRLTGAEDALVVNNNAAAVLLALETLGHGREVIVSRGELIEIGGEFRIPDIMLRSGATLQEVGATNRTHLRDYADAIT